MRWDEIKWYAIQSDTLWYEICRYQWILRWDKSWKERWEMRWEILDEMRWEMRDDRLDERWDRIYDLRNDVFIWKTLENSEK